MGASSFSHALARDFNVARIHSTRCMRSEGHISDRYMENPGGVPAENEISRSSYRGEHLSKFPIAQGRGIMLVAVRQGGHQPLSLILFDMPTLLPPVHVVPAAFAASTPRASFPADRG
eukprot:46928-Hanusia_phi.AAC.3